MVGMYIRLNIAETTAFAEVKATGEETKVPIVDLMKRYPGNVLAGMGAQFREPGGGGGMAVAAGV